MRYDPDNPICRAGKAIDDLLQGLRASSLAAQRPVPYGLVLHPDDTGALLALHEETLSLQQIVGGRMVVYGIHIMTWPSAEQGTVVVLPDEQSFLQWSQTETQIDPPEVSYATEREPARTYDSERDSFEHWVQGVDDLLREVRDG